MPHSVDIAVTGRCNLKCKHCYYADEMVGRSDLHTQTWLEFFEELCNSGVMRVNLTGGELFTRPDIWELFDGVVRNKMRFSFNTNATLITDQVAERLSLYRRLDYIQVSVDGSKPETHDALRGKRAFERAMRGIAALRKYGLPWTVRMTVSKLNLHDLKATMHMLHDDLGLQQFGVNEAYPMGAGHCNQGTLEMTPAERRESFHIMQEFDREHPGVARGAQAGPLIMAELIEKVNHAREFGEFKSSYKTGCFTGCNVMWQNLAILHDGSYVPCLQLPHMTLGKVGQETIRDIWYNSPKMLVFRLRHTISLETDPHCSGCAYIQYCTGGCPGVAYPLTGNINRANPRDCYRAYIGEDPQYAY
jgi:SynChlorMet cassette radical SAM/SPASM protein ScmE